MTEDTPHVAPPDGCLHVTAGGCSLTTSVVDRTPENTPGAGDLCLYVEATIAGFQGIGRFWIDSDVLAAFDRDLTLLHADFNSSATLEGMSPGQFSLTLTPANPRGYVDVAVTISGRPPHDCRLSGHFEVELSALASAVAWARAVRSQNDDDSR